MKIGTWRLVPDVWKSYCNYKREFGVEVHLTMYEGYWLNSGISIGRLGFGCGLMFYDLVERKHRMPELYWGGLIEWGRWDLSGAISLRDWQLRAVLEIEDGRFVELDVRIGPFTIVARYYLSEPEEG